MQEQPNHAKCRIILRALPIGDDFVRLIGLNVVTIMIDKRIIKITVIVVCVRVCSAMDARQFHHQHHNAVTSFDDVMDLCVDDDVMKQEPGDVSPREPGVSPPATTTTTTAVVDDRRVGLVSYRLDHDDSGPASSGVQSAMFDADVAAAVDMCLSDALRLPCLPAQRTDAGSPLDSDAYPPSAMRHASGGSAPRISPGQCKVCGDEATGMYFGALVCVPCKVMYTSFVKCNSRIALTLSPRRPC